MDESTASRLEQLVGETGWLRKLALSLVRDPAAADDVLHDTLLVAAEHGPPADRPLRPWLARVATNIARMRHRSSARQTAREARSPEAEPLPSAPDVLERVETQRLLTELVLALEAPYRDVILLHFFEGLTSAEIARRHGVPDGTIRWRLKRALDELRAKLDEKREHRAAWMMSLGAFARGPIVGGVVVKKLVVLLVVVLVMTIVVVSARRWRGQGPGEGIARPRTNEVLAARVPRWVIQPNVPARRIAGHVRYHGAPAAGVRVALRIGRQPDLAIVDVVSADDGSFDLGTPPPAEYVVIAYAPERTSAITELDTHDPHTRPDQLELELGGCDARATGRVTDAEGSPIIARVGLVGTTSDPSGHYELCRPLTSIVVTFAANGFGTVTTEFEGIGTIHRDLVLAPEGVIIGRVVHAATGVADANVIVTSAAARGDDTGITPTSTKTAGEGHFQIGGLAPGRYRVVATAAGLGSARVETYVLGASTRELVITVDERARVLGKVMLAGAPLAGVEVTSLGPANLVDAAPVFSQEDGSFAIDGVPHGLLHWAVRGYRVKSPSSTSVSAARLDGVVLEVEPGARLRGTVTSSGQPVAGAIVEYWHNEWSHGVSRTSKTTTTDRNGAYVLDDVTPGPSQIQAHTELEYVDTSWVEVLADRETVRDLAIDRMASASGVVVDASGAPVPDVDVVFQLDPAVKSWWHERTAVTDRAGAFHGALLSAGSYNVVVAPENGVYNQTFKLAHPVAVHLADDRSEVTGLRIEVVIDHLELRGNVVDEHGVPLPDVRVVLDGSPETDPNVVTALMPPSMMPNPAVISSSPTT
ncbi:MAG: sigma-70 family RNA polymerase sigma factor, partial [Kofleriaceae bacterium]